MTVATGERSPRRFYVDTSAYLCILLGEASWEALSKELSGAERLSSVLLLLEAHRNLVRLTREGTLTAEQYSVCAERVRRDRDAFVLRELTIDLCESAPMPAIAIPRSLDLAHLRTALSWHADQPLTRFVTMDGVQRHAARDLGLPT